MVVAGLKNDSVCQCECTTWFYFCSVYSFTAADCVLGFTLWWAYTIEQGRLLSGYPVLLAYLDRLQQRPAFQKSFSCNPRLEEEDHGWEWRRYFMACLEQGQDGDLVLEDWLLCNCYSTQEGSTYYTRMQCSNLEGDRRTLNWDCIVVCHHRRQHHRCHHLSRCCHQLLNIIFSRLISAQLGIVSSKRISDHHWALKLITEHVNRWSSINWSLLIIE